MTPESQTPVETAPVVPPPVPEPPISVMLPPNARMTRNFIIAIAVSFVIIGCGVALAMWQSGRVHAPNAPTETVKTVATSTGQTTALPEIPSIPAVADANFGENVAYEMPTSTINPLIAKNFETKGIPNLRDMEKAYGFTFSPDELQRLSRDKFVVKNLLDTSIRPNGFGDNVREFSQLYDAVKGPRDYKGRGPQNALFYSSDVFFNAYNNLYTELLKEMENKTFAPAMTSLSASLYNASNEKLKAASSTAEVKKWTKVRNYFAVPYAIFSIVGKTLTVEDYEGRDPAQVMAEHTAVDAKIDTQANVEALVKTLKLDPESEKAVMADVAHVYEASEPVAPSVFVDEYKAYSEQVGVEFKVDFTQFTPRATYTSSSLRRQYFRGMKWYIMLPFFLKSADLTTYAYATAQLLAENPVALGNYAQLESAINFMVGTSDDLMPVDYLYALQSASSSPDVAAAALSYLVKARDPKIKDLAATYQSIGKESTDEVRLKTKGMRFFGGKFIVDSYWTGFLTQGDEAVRPGYPAKLPPMASSLEVMTLLGSDYAKTQIPKLEFVTEQNALAIDKALGELAAENAKLTDADWMKNLYTGWLWTIKGLFSWQKANLAVLPAFMQSPTWNVKTLMTASAFWTELRHATILYAKQSFAELGGGGGGCDPRKVPAPPKAYIEPQREAFARLAYLAKRTSAGLKEQGYQLDNLNRLDSFVALMGKVQAYVEQELGNAALNEQVNRTERADPDEPSKKCVEYNIDLPAGSDWEALRVGIVDGLMDSLPSPVEGPVLPAKDRRAALVADVHTGGDFSYPRRILYEGEGVPYVIFTAVSDANGPRLTVGFTYSHYEFTKEYGGQRMTDEEWQKNFYTGIEPYEAYTYTDKATWPKENPWYAPLFGM